ncbi:hypothetical protein FA13DRAFT_1773487 [Coprinellus micaceus]|uniref:Uncharacterized protein n=1 Tax=Coprinellus micaceus TaxID=71717 RepID=A0A4Y7TGD3_COPMI|nr:hypothetical protein FA13DRAFT_1773487 [Coprinellus micaceus]
MNYRPPPAPSGFPLVVPHLYSFDRATSVTFHRTTLSSSVDSGRFLIGTTCRSIKPPPTLSRTCEGLSQDRPQDVACAETSVSVRQGTLEVGIKGLQIFSHPHTVQTQQWHYHLGTQSAYETQQIPDSLPPLPGEDVKSLLGDAFQEERVGDSLALWVISSLCRILGTHETASAQLALESGFIGLRWLLGF